MEEPESSSSLSDGLSVVAQLCVKHGLVRPEELQTILQTGFKDSTSLGSCLIGRGLLKPRQLEILYQIAACEMVGDSEGAAEATQRLKEVKASTQERSTMPELDPEIANAQSDPKRRFGKYALLNEIGRGAMGIVYRAWQADLRRVVALKILPSEMADDDERARFDREARTAASLHHSNIVRIHETGAIDNRQYYTMDFIDGKPLSNRIKLEGALPLDKALEMVEQVAMALHFAHDHGVVHRDIKPANILVDKDGRAFICDFGLAKSAHDHSMTMTGMVMGTPFYMSPEQAEGRTKEIDARSDVYSLGAVLYQVVTGALPFSGDDFGKLFDQIRNVMPTPPSERIKTLPRDLDAVVFTAMAKDPKKRYPSAMHLATDLRRLLKGMPTQAKRPAPAPKKTTSRITKIAPQKSQAPLFIGIGAVAVLALIIAGVLSGGSSSRERDLELEIERMKAKLSKTTDAAEAAKLQREIAAKMDSRHADPVAPQPVAPPPKVNPLASEWERVENNLAPYLKDRKFGEAIDKLHNYANPSPEAETWRQEREQAIRRDAKAAFREIMRAGQEHFDNARYRDALVEFRKVEALGMPEFTSEAKVPIEKIENAFRLVDRDSQVPKFAALRPLLIALCSQRKYPEAIAELEKSRADLPAMGTDIDTLKAIFAEASQALASLPAGVLALKSKAMELPVAGKIKKVEIRGFAEGRLQVLDGRNETSIPLAELRVTDIAALVAGKASPESIGLFELFEGRADLAKQTWKASIRKDELDAIADQAGVLVVPDNEAREQLDRLVDAHARKDWKTCREILLRRDRFADSPAWREAAGTIDRITSDSAEVTVDPTFAVNRRGAEWVYDFTQAAQLRDWQIAANDQVAKWTAGYGMRLEKDMMFLRNAQARFVAPFEAEGVLSADLVLAERGMSVFGVNVAGFAWHIRNRSVSTINAPSGKEIWMSKVGDITPGKPFSIKFVVSKTQAIAYLDNREVARCDTGEPLRSGPPSFFSVNDSALLIDRVSVGGILKTGWVEEHKKRQEMLAKAGKGFPYSPRDVLTDGRAMGKCRHEESGSCEVVDGAIRLTSDNVGLKCELHAPSFRNFRLRMKYQVLSGRFAELCVRMDENIRYMLPMDSDKWRDIEIVAAESAIYCQVDGTIQLIPDTWPMEIKGGDLRLRVEGGAISIRDLTVEELRGLAPESVMRRQEAPFYLLGGSAVAFVDGKWLPAPRLIEGVIHRAESPVKALFGDAKVFLDRGSRFVLIQERINLLEGRVSVEAPVDSKFTLQLGDARIHPEQKPGRSVMTAAPDRLWIEEGHAKSGASMLWEGTEYVLKKDALEGQPKGKRTLPPATRSTEKSIWKLDLANLGKGKLDIGTAVELPGGGRALKSALTKGNQYFSGGIDYDYESQSAYCTAKRNVAVRFRYFLQTAEFLQFMIKNMTQNKNYRTDLQAVGGQWETVTLWLMDITEEAEGKGDLSKLDDKYGGFKWWSGYQNKEPGDQLLIDSVQVIEIER